MHTSRQHVHVHTLKNIYRNPEKFQVKLASLLSHTTCPVAAGLRAMRLLLLILTSSCVISTAVVVFSVFLIYNNSNNAVIDHLVRGTELLSDGMGMFGYTRAGARLRWPPRWWVIICARLQFVRPETCVAVLLKDRTPCGGLS